MTPDYWDGWTHKPMTRDEIMEHINRLFVRLEQVKRGDPEGSSIIKQIRELSDRLKEGQ